MTKLKTRNLTKEFPGINVANSVTALENINLHIEEGQFICFVGPSWCGKTTLLNILAGLEKSTSGEVILNGQPVRETGPDRIMVFQENTLFTCLRDMA
ncbi:MAG: ATP-binding cassette domain-containing protein [Candidatus Nitrosopolaris sp.]